MPRQSRIHEDWLIKVPHSSTERHWGRRWHLNSKFNKAWPFRGGTRFGVLTPKHRSVPPHWCFVMLMRVTRGERKQRGEACHLLTFSTRWRMCSASGESRFPGPRQLCLSNAVGRSSRTIPTPGIGVRASAKPAPPSSRQPSSDDPVTSSYPNREKRDGHMAKETPRSPAIAFPETVLVIPWESGRNN